LRWKAYQKRRECVGHGRIKTNNRGCRDEVSRFERREGEVKIDLLGSPHRAGDAELTNRAILEDGSDPEPVEGVGVEATEEVLDLPLSEETNNNPVTKGGSVAWGIGLGLDLDLPLLDVEGEQKAGTNVNPADLEGGRGGLLGHDADINTARAEGGRRCG